MLPYEEAVAEGALALFGEKYEDRVRVLRLGDFSMELCGGTHVRRAGDIGLFKIVQETGIAAGVRRIEAITGRRALDWVAAGQSALEEIAGLLKAGRDDAGHKVRQLLDKTRSLEKELQQLKTKLATGGAGEDPLKDAVDVDGIKVYAARLDGADAKVLREAVDRFKNRLGSAVVVLGAAEGDKVRLVAGATKDVTDRVSSSDVVNAVAQFVGGKGGGRPDMAQAGGSDPSRLDEALARVRDIVGERLDKTA